MKNIIYYLFIFLFLYLLYKNFIIESMNNINNNTNTHPPLYYINVDTAIDRKQRYEERLFKYPNLYFEKISAITPASLKQYTINIPTHCNRSELEFSCTLSHIKSIFIAYKNITLNKDLPPYAFITEDDLVIIDLPNWNQLIDSAPPDWEILQLMAIGPFAEHMYTQNLQGWQPHLTDVIWSTAAYLINLKGMEKILQVSIPNYQFISNWDDVSFINLEYSNSNCVADVHLYSIAKTYTSQKPFFNVEGIDSSIHPDQLDLQRNTVNAIAGL